MNGYWAPTKLYVSTMVPLKLSILLLPIFAYFSFLFLLPVLLASILNSQSLVLGGIVCFWAIILHLGFLCSFLSHAHTTWLCLMYYYVLLLFSSVAILKHHISIPATVFVSSLFYFVSLGKGLSILLIFSKNQFLVSLIFFYCFILFFPPSVLGNV